MVLDSKIMLLRSKFGILRVSDWSKVSPNEILTTPDVGSKTLNHLRLHLAGHGITLKDDETPAFWQAHLFETKLGTIQVSDEDNSVVCPFTIIVDAQEKHPWTFQGFRTDSDLGERRPILVRTKVAGLGATHGDYTMAGFEGVCHIERKSKEDAMGTILGWGDRRERFKATLEFLASIKVAAVVIECTFGDLVNSAESRGVKSIAENRLILHRQVLAWATDYRVPFIFSDDRRFAEANAFRIMARCYSKQITSQKKSEKKVSVENA